MIVMHVIKIIKM